MFPIISLSRRVACQQPWLSQVLTAPLPAPLTAGAAPVSTQIVARSAVFEASMPHQCVNGFALVESMFQQQPSAWP